MCNKIFYTKNENGIKIYFMDNFKEYDGITYRACADGGVFFFGDENIIFNENGKSCKVSGIEGIAYNGISFLNKGYVCVRTANQSFIIDVEGKGTKVEAPYSIYFSDLVSCYMYEGIYYDYDGNEIINTKGN